MNALVAILDSAPVAMSYLLPGLSFMHGILIIMAVDLL